MRVGLIGSPDREELQRLAMRIEERGSEGVIFDPAEAALELHSGGESIGGVDLARFKAFYVADLCLPAPRGAEPDPERDQRSMRASKRHLVAWNALLGRLARRARVVNPPTTWELHSLKPWELARYRAAGLPAPRTLSTSAAAALAAPEGAEQWIRKGMVGGSGYTSSYTPPATEAEAAAELREGPLLIQERVAGENVRAYVVNGERVGAAQSFEVKPVPTAPCPRRPSAWRSKPPRSGPCASRPSTSCATRSPASTACSSATPRRSSSTSSGSAASTSRAPWPTA